MNHRRQTLDQAKVRRGRVLVIEEHCKGCGFCVDYCPKGVLVLSERFNRKGYHPPEVVKPENCVDCGLCTMICPDFAIFCEAVEAGAETASRPWRAAS